MARPLPRTPDQWRKEIRLAWKDAGEAKPFGPLTGMKITDANLFHLAPVVCLKFRGRRLTGREADRVTKTALAESLGKDLGCPWGDFSRLEPSVSAADIVIHTTPVGMANTPLRGRSLVRADLLRADMTVMDIVTNPRKTQLLEDAESRGCQVVYGDRMLLWQGVYKFKLYTGVEPPVQVMEQAMEQMQ